MPRQVLQDIIELVIYELRDDRATLLKCCTVSHSFLTPSLKQLFFDIEIPNYRGASILASLNHVLSIHPGYLSYIRILRISGFNMGLYKRRFLRLVEAIADRGVLRVFRLRMTRSSGGVWEALPVPIRAVFARLFQSPNLHTISLSNMCGYTFPLHLLGLATGLRHLDFVGDHDSSCHHPTVVSPMIHPLPSAASYDVYLESLQMTLQTNASALVGYLSRPDCPLKISQLRELWIDRATGPHHLPATVATVVKGASRSLESFIWIMDTCYGMLIDLSARR